ncbi:hypothetical protein CLV51_104376 [Chitinophaga niastensis]|uniref:Uncharacterized protein n=1 Tax=Chitinophaga niastensis TaxID=536980 RepID=A0A2P8HHK3_CHINA|nr:hypothetical protein [Chitinophaga niastensis]PSL45669.1 hypothetical protein CLV51_104376 [Chitinophaga niastensis]
MKKNINWQQAIEKFPALNEVNQTFSKYGYSPKNVLMFEGNYTAENFSFNNFETEKPDFIVINGDAAFTKDFYAGSLDEDGDNDFGVYVTGNLSCNRLFMKDNEILIGGDLVAKTHIECSANGFEQGSLIVQGKTHCPYVFKEGWATLISLNLQNGKELSAADLEAYRDNFFNKDWGEFDYKAMIALWEG